MRNADSMHAILVEDEGRLLRWGPAPRPTLGPGQVRIRVHATAVNRADLLQRIGRYPPPPGASEILGLEAAGEVLEVADDVSTVSVSDRVCVLLEGGGYAEEVVVDAPMALPVPAHMSFEEAAALPEALYTAWTNLVHEGQLVRGETALVLAAASGVGTAAVQIAAHLGARVVATASATKLEAVRGLGADVALDRRREDLASALDEALGEGADVVFDPVGGPAVGQHLKRMRRCGRLVVIGLLGGVRAEIPLNVLLMKRLRIIGSVLRSRSRAEKVVLTAGLQADLWDGVVSGQIRPVVCDVLNIEDAQRAHDRMQADDVVGKLVLRIPS